MVFDSRAVRSLVLPLVLAAAALDGPRAAAQALYQGRSHWHDLREGPQGPFLSRYGTGIALQFTSGPGVDYLGLAGNKVRLWVKPALHDARVPLQISGNDLAGQLDFRAVGGQAIVVPGQGGLGRYWYDGGVLQSETLGDASWNDAKRVASGQLAGDDGQDFVGVGADAVSVLLLVQQPDQSFAAGQGFTLPDLVKQVEVLDLDDAVTGDGLQEIAFRYRSSIQIYEADGDLRCTIDPTDAVVTMAPLRDDSVAAQHLAVVTQDGAGKQHIVIYDGLGVELGSHPLGNYKTRACTPLDFDGQGGIEELALSTTIVGYPIVVYFSDVTSASATTIEPLFVPGRHGPDPGNRSVLVAADFDNDGDQDIVYSFHGTDERIFYRGYAIDDDRPSFAAGSDPGDGKLYLTWDIPVGGLPGADGVQFVAWNKRGLVSEIPTLEIESPTPYFNHVESLVSQTQITVTVDLGSDYADWTGGDLSLYFAARFVEWDAGGAHIQRGSASVEVMAGQMYTVEELYLLSFFGGPAGQPEPWDSINNPGGGGSWGDDTVFPHPTKPDHE